jgi:hypothetical protein
MPEWDLTQIQVEEIQDLRWWTLDEAKGSDNTRPELQDTPWGLVDTSAAGITVFVYNYLANHYEAKDIEWVLDSAWQLVDDLPLDLIDYENRPDGESEDHVDDMMAKIVKQPFKIKPVVVVENDGRYVVADGYHRCAAFAQLGLSTIAAYVASASSGWEVMVGRMQADVTNHPLNK